MIDRNGMSQSRQVRARALGSSAMTVALMLAGPAFAQCAPDPTIANGTTVCSGTDADGLRVTTRGTNVLVEQGATVRGSSDSAIGVAFPSADLGNPVTISVAGTVDGGQYAGIRQLLNSSYDDYNPQSLLLNIAAGGRVTGDIGVFLNRLPPPPSGQFVQYGNAYIDNSGDISGTGGYALYAVSDDLFFSGIINRAGGTIGAIYGKVDVLDNAGTIDGGTRSAIELTGNAYANLENVGTIRSNSNRATFIINTPRTLGNSGTIENSGSGAAIESDILFLFNTSTGRIASATGAAITASDWIYLANAGTIVGDVVAGGTGSTLGSTVNASAGRITGSLTFGSASDTLIGTYDGTQLRYGVDGTINGGDGTDIVRVGFSSNTTMATPLTLPTAFEQLSMVTDAGVTTTFAPGFTLPTTLLIGGNGTFVNDAALTTLNQVIANDTSLFGTPGFVNNGTATMTTTLGNTIYAINLTQFSRFENNGTVSSGRNAVSLNGSGSVVNNGTVNSDLTGMRVIDSSSFTNSTTGVIQSTNGIALALTGTATIPHTNAGRVDGRTGARLTSTSLSNTGTIQGVQTGTVLAGSATLENQAGGVVSGPTAISGLLSGVYSSNNVVANAGTINGNVVFADPTDTVTTTSTRNRYFALPGGVLNGDLTLGRGDVLVTDFVNTGTGAFAGINGQVTANRSALRLRVRADATTALAGREGFTSLGYELSNDARLTVSGTSDQTLLVAGRGSVDLSGDITTVLRAAIQSIAPTLAPGETAATNALNITSSGDLSLLRIEEGNFTGAAVMLQNGDRFTNSGTISVTDRADLNSNEVAAISGAAVNTGSGSASQVTNSGRISLSGAIGIRDTGTIVNTGTISQSTRNRMSVGVLGSSSYATTLTNSGTINVGGVAVQTDTGSMTIANSGRIASFGGLAIALGGAGTINNATSGTITGGLVEGQTERLAIRTAGGTLTNAGTITGTVDLGYSTFGRSSNIATYIQDGGSIEGGLLFGNGDDTLIAYTPLNINGTIDGGSGFDTLIQARRASDTVTLSMNAATNFERQGVRAIGTDTVVTLRAIEPITGASTLR